MNDKVKVVIRPVPPPNVVFVWWQLALSIAWGLFLGFNIAWLGATWAGFFMAGVFGVLLGMFYYGSRLWERRAQFAMNNHLHLLEYCNIKARTDLENFLQRVITQFFDDSPIQNYAIQISDEKMVVKVGDDDCMVPLDMEKLGEDPVAACEQARLAWMAAKGENDSY